MELLTEDIHHIIKSHLKSENFYFISCKNVCSDDVSTGFLSAQNKRCIIYLAYGRIQEIYIFIKQLPEFEYHRNSVIEMGSFERETLVFADIFADFQYFSVPIPKFYLAKPDGVIVLEDLTRRGFRTRNIHETLDLAHCEKVLESLAKFHAASFVIEDKSGSKLNELYPILNIEVLLNPNYAVRRTIMAGVEASKRIAEKYLSHYPNDLTEQAFEFMEKILGKAERWDTYPNALSHSDLWGNNIMYKADEDGNVEQACLLDLQCATYKPPSYDVQFFLHVCATKELRDSCYPQLLKFYYDCLSEELMRSNIDLAGMMPWSAFQRMQKDTLPKVLAVTVLYHGFVLMPTEIVKEVMVSDDKFRVYFEQDRTEYVLRAMSENQNFHDRNIRSLEELFDHIAENFI